MTEQTTEWASRVAVITGAGQGLGRCHALHLAALGAAVVVNDVARDEAGNALADQVAAEIRDAGGRAEAHTESIASWSGGESLVNTALDAFGGLHAVVNNAGITRHSSILDMPEELWDGVLEVNLKGTFSTIRAASRYWRDQAEHGSPVTASIVNTTSRAGLFPGSAAINGANAGMANYGSSKAGVTALTEISARELAGLGVRVNCVSPSARTRLTSRGQLAAAVAPPSDGSFDIWDPANISPVVAWLLSPECPLTGQVLWVKGGDVHAVQTPRVIGKLSHDGRWTSELLTAQLTWFEDMAAISSEYPEF